MLVERFLGHPNRPLRACDSLPIWPGIIIFPQSATVMLLRFGPFSNCNY
jgi:hypothetical protein